MRFRPCRSFLRCLTGGVVIILGLIQLNNPYKTKDPGSFMTLAHHKKKYDPDVQSRSNQVMHLVIVACEWKSQNTFNEVLNLVKSTTLFTRGRLRIHIFTLNLKQKLLDELSKWPRRIREKLDLLIHPLVYPLPHDETEEMLNWWGRCASFRLFLPTVMNDTDAIIYVDTDILFLGPVEKLWAHFHHFGPSHVGALSPRVGWEFKVPRNNPNYIETPEGKMTQINSGVFLMNLTRMREEVFSIATELSSRKFSWDREFLLPLYRSNMKNMIGDQNLINIAFHYNPDLLYFLPCRYNYHHKFCFDRYKERLCQSAEEHGAFAVHGSANTYYNNYSPAFRVINDVITKYNFESNLTRTILDRIAEGLNDPSVTEHAHCSDKFHLFMQTLKYSIRNRTR